MVPPKTANLYANLRQNVCRAIVCLLDQWMYVSVIRDARCIGIFGEWAKTEAESLVVIVRELLLAQIDQFVAKQRVT